ncbi:MAG: hypothetical protein CM15mP106_7510 [Candidatus Neomarinimicrobiota bacterium]|nr:MAG: hypothetical protein CM15mP106_7510 [Candidatus Neomarinimicrobiota bacterium]
MIMMLNLFWNQYKFKCHRCELFSQQSTVMECIPWKYKAGWFFNFQPSNLSLENKSIPAFYYLNHNFPNPFNPTTRITYNLPKETLVSIIIYDLLGKKVNTLIDKELQEPGTKTVQWHGKNQEGLSLSSGVYFYSLETKDFAEKKNDFN